jgi:phytoene desaturase
VAFVASTQRSATAPIVIVGGGLGGLSAAIHLAARGRRVVLCEKNERVGGKLNIVAEEGYAFDTGPSLLTMPWVLRELFAVAGQRLEDELTLIQVEPTCRYRWPDGARFDSFQSLPLLIQEIARIEPRDVAGFFRFMAYAERIYRAVAGPFLLHPFDGLRDLLTLATLHDAWAIDPFRTVDQAVRGFFRSARLRQVFDRYATYNGSSPYRAPATFNLIAYIEFAEGGWYVRGGMYELARALERLACALGVEVRTGSPVAQIAIREGVAHGVILETGERLEAAAVVVNADPRYAYETLIPAGQSAAARLARLEPSCSGFVLLLGVDRVYTDLAHHNIFFSANYRGEFAAIFDKRVPAPDPTIYICATSVSDRSHAPPGHMNLFALVNAPALGPMVNWNREAVGYRDLVVRKLERMGLANLDRHIVYERIITPADLQSRYNAPGGAIYGLASNQPWTAFLRPPLRARDARGLFFVGGGTHPGGGIPLVLLSGRAVAERVLADEWQ